MNKRLRQYAGLLAAIAAYYLIHEGAHLVYALLIGLFKQVNIAALGVKDIVIVTTSDSVLVASKDRVQDLKKLLSTIGPRRSRASRRPTA